MFRELPLTKGKTAVVDEEDYYWLAQWNWCATQISGNWYARRCKKKGTLRTGEKYEVYLHRIVSRVSNSEMVVDHINHDTLDNRRSNLRIITKAQNNRSTSSRKNSNSQYLGVTYVKEKWRVKRWLAQLTFNGERVLQRRYLTEEEAARAYDKCAAQTFGEFANLNFKN